MKRILSVVIAGLAVSAVAARPAMADYWSSKDKPAAAAVKTAAKSEAKPAAPAPAAPLTPDEEAARALKGVENQKAWIATLEKQLEGEKAKLTQMEAAAAKYGATSKKSADKQEA